MGKKLFSLTPASASCVSNAALLELAHMGSSTILAEQLLTLTPAHNPSFTSEFK